MSGLPSSGSKVSHVFVSIIFETSSMYSIPSNIISIYRLGLLYRQFRHLRIDLPHRLQIFRTQPLVIFSFTPYPRRRSPLIQTVSQPHPDFCRTWEIQVFCWHGSEDNVFAFEWIVEHWTSLFSGITGKRMNRQRSRGEAG